MQKGCDISIIRRILGFIESLTWSVRAVCSLPACSPTPCSSLKQSHSHHCYSPTTKNHNLFISRSIQSTDWWENHLCVNAAFKANQSKCGTKDEFSYKRFNKLLMIEVLLFTTRRSQANKGLICKMLETYWEILKITHCSYYLCLESRLFSP